ncbi:MAG: hypothetical protein Q9180_000411 [Flavoplaca navasiana]
MDQYINYDPSSLVPPSSQNSDTTRTDCSSTPFDNNKYTGSLLPSQSNQQTFAGPSHQYELHKQQTGLPMGALANTLAVNQNDHIVHGQAHRMSSFAPTDFYFDMNDGFDFNTVPSQTLGTDMDMDFAASIQDVNADYINPSAVGGEASSLGSVAPKQRAWPGMHQQHAKAQAEAQRLQTLAQQQQNRSLSRPPSQRPLGNPVPAKDPIVDERISRLLNQMRHSSVTSSADDAPTPTANANANASHLGRAKKDEEDMDEDERLLASEEGKRLSSKERRQLRNKVSARAFRSRRKEYIGQLEGEIAAKSAEADDLRAKNQALMAENTRLTDLTRMLLESPSFSAFLDAMSGTEKQPATRSQQEPTDLKIEEVHQHRPKDISPHQSPPQAGSEHEDAQVGVALLPESYVNFNTGNTTWAPNTDFGLYDAQVYAVTSMPQGPAVDHFDGGLLSGKSSNLPIGFDDGERKPDAPTIEFPIGPRHEFLSQDQSYEQPDEDSVQPHDNKLAFGLSNNDIPVPPRMRISSPYNTVLDSPLLPKTCDDLGLMAVDNASVNGRVDIAAMQRFVRLCASMEAASQRVASVTSHL